MTDRKQILPNGTMLHGDTYKVVRCLGAGGFGITYEVEHVQLGERMCMKEFFMDTINLRNDSEVTVSVEANRATFDKMREKFHREAQRVRKLREKHIVEVTDLFMENGTSYYVMQLIDGESLDARLRRTGQPLSGAETRSILMQVLAALKCVHEHHLQHLDLKPANIMADANVHIWLIDFGASKLVSIEEGKELTVSSTLCYTVGYAPSEQVEQNLDRLGPWTDFYALGATLYNLQTCRKPPLPSEVNDEGEKAFTFPDQMSADMRNLILWLMQPRRNDRPQSVEEIEQRLSVKQEEPLFTPPSTPDDNKTTLSTQPAPEKESHETVIARRPSKRNLKWPLIVAAAVAAIVIAVVLLIGGNGKKKAKSNDDEPIWIEATQEQKDSILCALIEEERYSRALPVEPEYPEYADDSIAWMRYYDEMAEYNAALAEIEYVDTTSEYFKEQYEAAVAAFEEYLNKPYE